jgi:transposase-like protein
MRIVVFQLLCESRDVELMMAFRGVQLSYETIRRWCDKFGKPYADQLRRKRGKPGDKWHLDEVFLKINGVQHLFVESGGSARCRDRYSRATQAGSICCGALLS